jgi:hypothetical protein
VVGELVAVVLTVETHGPSLDARLPFMDRFDLENTSDRMAPVTKLVRREGRFYFIGLAVREVICSVAFVGISVATS